MYTIQSCVYKVKVELFKQIGGSESLCVTVFAVGSVQLSVLLGGRLSVQ